ncbi:MerR family transcriptional regulator [Ferrimonas balearica]|uniref:MerR family transcriptional regulator n=1 Tax=Ferrimonas balearica TaxID=44012 RepID=UPI001C99A401|nr:MerR family transcriptional regulator [Ferrimonas balearica]MBY5993872.1 MerR family transcriptional regulator [Ferrimonas balearica]
MLTVTQLARQAKLSRTTLLYYERAGLLSPTTRSDSGYRLYGPEAQARLAQIAAYRSYGLPLARIRQLLEGEDSGQPKLLKEHFHQLEQEIARLRAQQRAILAVLEPGLPLPEQAVTKARWVAIMAASGFDEAAMRDWHRNFERMEPEAHQQFLESLGIDDAEIRRIRQL